MQSNELAFISLEDVEADDFLLGNFTKISLPGNGKQTSDNKHKIPLNQMSSPRVKEAAVIKDLLYVLTGQEGIYVKYTDDVHDHDILKSLKGNTYKVSKEIDINFKDIAKQLCHLGKHYSALSYFVIYFNKSYYGMVLSRLCQYIRNFLKEYQVSVCKFYELFDNDPNFSIISLYQTLHSINEASTYPSFAKSLEFLYSLTQQIIDDNNERLKDSNLLDMKFKTIMQTLKEDMNTNILDEVSLDSQNSKYVKGGVVLNMIYSHMESFKGDVRFHNLINDVYEFVCPDYINILNEWLQYGKISDPFEEFFIVDSTSESKPSTYDSYHWMNKYAIKREGLLKQFQSQEFQKQIFFTGKYLSIINECDSDDKITHIPFIPIKSLQDKNLELIIHDAYVRSNNMIYKLLCSGYKLPEYVALLNKYFLITDGSLFENFLNQSNHELKRSFNSASTSLITVSYNKAYEKDSYNNVEMLVLNLLDTKFERHSLLDDILEIIKTLVTDANEIFNASNLGKLSDLMKTNLQNNTRPATSSGSEIEDQRCNKLAISRFNININIPFPLNQVILDSQKLEYQILFRHSALVRFIEKRFEKSWRELGYQTFWTWNFEDSRKKLIELCEYIGYYGEIDSPKMLSLHSKIVSSFKI
ncbi:hypothetical protein C6P40_001575 [Pichia californica]|uniref:Spindle pole body component n=1 Tax=Pichia californica TaxID=460514 RepID=A0A9P7BEK1_9ASCO|nr:hypothetical protein C6P40_001575 [[Candida] californica]